MKLKKKLKRLKLFKYYYTGKQFLSNKIFLKVQVDTKKEISKIPSRTEIINYILSTRKGETKYLEIGVRNPNDNFNHIRAHNKYSVDPGFEFLENPVDFKMTSDIFFAKLAAGEILTSNIKFDVIFIDGLHIAEQVDKDIINALNYVADDGFVLLHDCNPPSEWHARESFDFKYSPAGKYWNGTTWKAFMKWRFNPRVFSCCIDTDWGVGIISKKQPIGNSIEPSNSFYEFYLFQENKSTHLNLIDFQTFKSLLNN